MAGPEAVEEITAVARTRLPKKEIAILGAIYTSTAAQYGLTATLLVYMVQSYGIAERPEDVGLYTGILTSMASLGQLLTSTLWGHLSDRTGRKTSMAPLGQLLTSMLWGHLSDRTGRKPWLALGVGATALTCLLLGVARSFPLACLVLFLYGVLHCTVLMTKSVMGELCDASNQAQGFAVLVFSWGLGMILGPFGSLLAQPCKSGGVLVGTCIGLLAHFPFLLPFALAALYHTVTALSILLLPETNPTKHPAASDCYEEIPCGPLPEKKRSSRSCWSALGKKAEESQQEKWLLEGAMEEGLTRPDMESAKLGLHGGGLSLAAVLVCIMYGSLNFLQIYADTLFSIFAAAPQPAGGLGYSASSMGLINGCFGCLILTYIVLIFPPIGRRLGALNCVKLGFLLFVPLWMMAPLCAWFHHLPAVKLALVLGFKALRAVVGATAYTGAMMVVSNAASSANLGLVTGLGETFGCILMSLGPTSAGGLWTLLSPQTFPLHQFVPWLLPTALSAAIFVLTLFLPASLNQPQARDPM